MTNTPAFKLSREDFCVVVLDRERFDIVCQWWVDCACTTFPHHVMLGNQVVQFQLGRFFVQDATAIELLRESYREQQGY